MRMSVYVDRVGIQFGYYAVRFKAGLCLPMTSTNFEDNYEAAPLPTTEPSP